MCWSISTIFSIDEGSSSLDVTRFSTANTTPSPTWIPIPVLPSCTRGPIIDHNHNDSHMRASVLAIVSRVRNERLSLAREDGVIP